MKKALDLSTGREVAVKILTFLQGDEDTVEARKEMLESFYQEILILSYCKHPNIVQLLSASFNGTLLKEEDSLRKLSVEQSALDDDAVVCRRKTNVCYCVLKLASLGELYKMVEGTERFSEQLSRSLFVQLVQGKLLISYIGPRSRVPPQQGGHAPGHQAGEPPDHLERTSGHWRLRPRLRVPALGGEAGLRD